MVSINSVAVGAPPVSRGSSRGSRHLAAIALVAALGWLPGADLARAERGNPRPDSSIKEIYVDDVWAANRVGFALQTEGRRQYVAYYDADRMMTLASRDLGETLWRKTTLPNRLVWDSHNRVVLGVDERGRLHVSGNMHCNPLSYFRSERPHDIQTMTAGPMLGRDEDRVTYPRFFYDRDGSLLFSYRSGTCGDGNILVNRFESAEQRWVRHLETPLFQGVVNNEDRAAYHRFTRDADGNFHFVWVWRWTPLVETCHQLCYATTPDLIHWQNAAGEPVDLPFTPDTQAVIVDDAPSQGGLHNSRFQIFLTPEGQPLIGYTRYDERGMTQLFVAKHDGQEWRCKQVSDWDFRWKFVGGGDQMTTGGKFRFEGFTPTGALLIPWSTETGASGVYALDTETLKPMAYDGTVAKEYPPAVYEQMTADPSLSVRLADDQGGNSASSVRYVLKWETQDPSHGKHAPTPIPDGPLSRLVVLEIR